MGSDPPAGASATEGAAAASLATSSMWAALSQMAVLGTSAVAALVILLQFGKSADTDAVFAAYGVYGVLLLVCQALRLTVVPRIVQSASPWTAFDRHLGAGVTLALIAALGMIVLAGPIAALLTAELGSEARSIARWTLTILWPALCAQYVTALGAAVMAVNGEFRYPGLAYVLGGVACVAVLVALLGPLDILSFPTGVAIGSALTAAAVMRRLRRLGYRPDVRRLVEGARRSRTAAVLLLGSAAPLLVQLNYVASVAFAARLGPGEVTLYTTAYFASAVVIAVTASAASLVLAAPVASTWDRRPASLLPHVTTVMRAGLIIIAPTVAAAALIGDDLIDTLLGAAFSPADADQIVGAFVALSGLFVGTLATQLPLLAAMAISRYGAVAWLSLLTSGVHVAASAVGLALGSVVWLGAATSVGALTGAALLLGLIHGRDAGSALVVIARECAVLGGACLVTFGAAGLAARALGSGAWDIPAALVAAVAFALVIRAALPSHRATAQRMFAPLLRGRARTATA